MSELLETAFKLSERIDHFWLLSITVNGVVVGWLVSLMSASSSPLNWASKAGITVAYVIPHVGTWLTIVRHRRAFDKVAAWVRTRSQDAGDILSTFAVRSYFWVHAPHLVLMLLVLVSIWTPALGSHVVPLPAPK